MGQRRLILYGVLMSSSEQRLVISSVALFIHRILSMTEYSCAYTWIFLLTTVYLPSMTSCYAARGLHRFLERYKSCTFVLRFFFVLSYDFSLFSWATKHRQKVDIFSSDGITNMFFFFCQSTMHLLSSPLPTFDSIYIYVRQRQQGA